MQDFTPQGEFHHFQLVNGNGEIPFSISVLVHYNQPSQNRFVDEPLTADDCLQLHEDLQHFDGDYSKAFSQ